MGISPPLNFDGRHGIERHGFGQAGLLRARIEKKARSEERRVSAIDSGRSVPDVLKSGE
jgi:hypothetical protein